MDCKSRTRFRRKTDVEGGEPPVTLRHCICSILLKLPVELPPWTGGNAQKAGFAKPQESRGMQ